MTASISNYTVGKGIVSFKKTGAADYVDLGNCPSFEFTPSLDKLEHYSSRSGVKTKDKTIVVQKSGEVKLVLEEFTPDNLALAVLGTVTTANGDSTIDIFGSDSVTGMLKFTGTNDVGPKYEWVFDSVTFVPSSAIALISEEWGTLELTGDVQAVSGSFGSITTI